MRSGAVYSSASIIWYIWLQLGHLINWRNNIFVGYCPSGVLETSTCLKKLWHGLLLCCLFVCFFYPVGSVYAPKDQVRLQSIVFFSTSLERSDYSSSFVTVTVCGVPSTAWGTQNWHETKWAMSWENLFLPYANNKDADQPAQPRSLISTVVIHCWDSIIPQMLSNNCQLP